MHVNRDKPDRWKQDIARSVDMYNDWFLRFAPAAYRETRIQATSDVEATLNATQYLTDVGVALLRSNPAVLPTLRMSACPPLAVDRLVGLSGVSKTLVNSMEKKHRLPPRMPRRSGVVADAPILSDYFTVKRGLATGDNSYFILSAEEVERRKLPYEAFRPILPSPRYVSDDEIPEDSDGNPLLERRLYLLDCPLTEGDIKTRYPSLWEYLEEGKSGRVAKRYLCRHRRPWYDQENRPAAPLVCTYLGRSDTKAGGHSGSS